MEKEISAKKREKNENKEINEATTKKLSELESKLNETEKEKHKMRNDRDNL